MALRCIDDTQKNIYNLLCNLSSENDSILLNAIADEKESLESDKNRTINSIANLKNKLSYEEENMRILSNGLSQAISFFQTYDSNIDLQKYFGLLDVNSDFLDSAKKAVEDEQDSGKLSKNVSSIIEELDDEITKLSDDLKEMDELLESNLETYNSTVITTHDLAFLIEGTLRGNGSFNMDYVLSLLEPISEIAKKYEIIFPDDFIDKASKAIFFPNDGFSDRQIEYTNGIDKEIIFTENGIKKAIIEPVEEDTDEVNELDTIDFREMSAEEETEPVEEETEEITETEEENTEQIADTEPVLEEQELVPDVNIDNQLISGDDAIQELEEQLQKQITTGDTEETTEVVSEDIVPQEFEGNPFVEIEDTSKKEEETAPIEEVDTSVETYSLDENKCSPELLDLLKNADGSLVKKNMEELEILNCDKEYYYYKDGYSYLTDTELSSKLNLLRSKRIDDAAIAQAISCHFISDSFGELEEKIKVVEQNGEFNKNYLPLLKYNPSKFFEAISNLNDYSIEPDEKEKLQYLVLLANGSDNIIGDTEVLKEYEVSLLRKNGKYELGLYTKTPLQLQKSLDDIIETGEEDLIATTPEVLREDSDYIVRMIKYLQDNNIDYKDDGTYAEFISKPMLFKSQFPEAELDELESVSSSNEKLASALNNEYCSLLINILTRYYESENSYKQISLTEEERIDCDRLKEMFREQMGAELVGKSTYKINNIYVSRNKFERNLNFLVSGLKSKGQDVIAMGKEILLVCALFGSRKCNTKNFELPEVAKSDDMSRGGMAA